MKSNSDEGIKYQIIVKGGLSDDWIPWMNGRVISMYQLIEKPDETILIATIIDQAALRGILNKLWDLNLTLISATQEKEVYGE
jgi:hypothetical protein